MIEIDHTDLEPVDMTEQRVREEIAKACTCHEKANCERVIKFRTTDGDMEYKLRACEIQLKKDTP